MITSQYSRGDAVTFAVAGQTRSVVPLVFEAAHQGNAVARELVKRALTEVGVTANAIIHRLGLQATGTEVVLGGGGFRGQGLLPCETVWNLD